MTMAQGRSGGRGSHNEGVTGAGGSISKANDWVLTALDERSLRSKLNTNWRPWFLDMGASESYLTWEHMLPKQVTQAKAEALEISTSETIPSFPG